MLNANYKIASNNEIACLLTLELMYQFVGFLCKMNDFFDKMRVDDSYLGYVFVVDHFLHFVDQKVYFAGTNVTRLILN